MKLDSRIYIAGHEGLVGSAIYSTLKKKGYTRLITRTHKDLDLIDCLAVEDFFEAEKPEYVFLAAARVGGIVANNTYRAEFIYENLMIQTNVIHYSYLNEVKKLMFLGSTCIYPKESPQPIKEEALLTGELEYTNEPYAIAKIAGIKMCESYNLQYGTNFIAVMPTNLYGPRDNFHLETSHVLPALIRKMHLGKALEENNWEAVRDDLNRRPIEGLDGSQGKKDILEILKKYGISSNSQSEVNEGVKEVSVEIWGSGQPLREFLWSEEMADACVFLMENRDFGDIISLREVSEERNQEIRNTHINIGTGREISIAHLAEITRVIVGLRGKLHFNTDKPDGALRKLTDVSKLNALGWKYEVELDEGIYRLYKWYKSSIYNLELTNRR
ncbi:GDP-L-fucose synthase [Antarcticibacterium flavum]|uniref:GDP-L-fucose synthase n=1 Tax=Antarcticibacterium flavum TaxID=2058175 RepID=A0A5B7X860_9FLAO|nr:MULTISPECIES: GDP-L-fucose synthase [Antarcticibacterium]MCM4160810.1 GDP-L-fucose synthase [Antarcticibacterium sp. W02-3]QCY71315.1 GDP-L-fucose synthase [Antarcticibacterium flavum]